MSEQVATPQVEDVGATAAAAVDVQPEQAVEAPASSSDQKPAEEVKGEEVAQPAPSSSEEEAEKKPEAEQEKAEPAAEKKEEEKEEEEKKDEPINDKVASDVDQEKVAEEKPVEVAKEEVSVESNGNSKNGEAQINNSTEETDKVVAEETNGVCKRKAENGTEVVDDEKSPKKAKVVDDGDQAPVEETAA